MPYADPEKERKCQQESYRRRAASIAARKKARYWERVDITRANENERNWRMGFHARRFRGMFDLIRQRLSVVNALELSNPTFTFVYRGQVKREHLREPLPIFRK